MSPEQARIEALRIAAKADRFGAWFGNYGMIRQEAGLAAAEGFLRVVDGCYVITTAGLALLAAHYRARYIAEQVERGVPAEAAEREADRRIEMCDAENICDPEARALVLAMMRYARH